MAEAEAEAVTATATATAAVTAGSLDDAGYVLLMMQIPRKVVVVQIRMQSLLAGIGRLGKVDSNLGTLLGPAARILPEPRLGLGVGKPV